jgi:hypothetical protein
MKDELIKNIKIFEESEKNFFSKIKNFFTQKKFFAAIRHL